MELGTRVRIDSPTYTALGGKWSHSPKVVGQTGTVATPVDSLGDVYVRLDSTETLLPFDPSGLTPIARKEPS